MYLAGGIAKSLPALISPLRLWRGAVLKTTSVFIGYLHAIADPGTMAKECSFALGLS